MSAPARPVVVLGLMGAGKSTLASALATRTGRPLRDSDLDIERETGRTAHDIAQASAERLHALEAAQLLAALADPRSVVAAAASVVDTPAGREALGQAFVVWLDAPVEVLVDRFRSGPHRPVYDPDIGRMLHEQATRRVPWLSELADLRLDATRPVDQLVATVLAHLAGPDTAAGPASG